MTADTWWMTQRRLQVFVRQPWFLVFTLIQPVIWLFLFGNLFKRVVDLPGFGSTSYLTYIVPGVVVMSAMASNMWAGMGTMEEIERGTLNRFLVTPVRRGFSARSGSGMSPARPAAVGCRMRSTPAHDGVRAGRTA